MTRSRNLIALLMLATVASLGLNACGGGASGGPESSARDAPPRGEFPAPRGSTATDFLKEHGEADLVVSPVGRVFRKGPNRYGFGVFELDRTQVDDADVAMYFAPGLEAPLRGPFPAAVESLETKPAFAAMTTTEDPEAARTVYVAEPVPLDRDGEWVGVALIRDESGALSATLVPSLVVGENPGIPDIGEPAPRVQTPTPESVGGDLAKIDTRVPPSDMHADFSEVLGAKPVALLFATPQLCQARVCGPVVDVLAQIKEETGDRAEFIHMEIFKDNDPSKGLRPQVREFGLPTEPWLFVIDGNGVVRERIEGAFGLEELRQGLRRAGA